MTTKPQTLEDYARDLAERTYDWFEGTNEGSPKHTELDARFAALRGEHDFDDEYSYCHRCKREWVENGGEIPDSAYSDTDCPRTDLGSIVRAAAACGLETRCHEDGSVTMFYFPKPGFKYGSQSWGDITCYDTELAAIKALYEAVS